MTRRTERIRAAVNNEPSEMKVTQVPDGRLCCYVLDDGGDSPSETDTWLVGHAVDLVHYR